MRTLIVATFFCIVASSFRLADASLITNGDFEAGNSGFASGYLFISAPGTSATPGTYAIRTNPTHYNPGLQSFGDHTTGLGNMLLVDGVGGTIAWQQTVAVTANTDYTFQAWATPTSLPFPASVRFTANDVSLGLLALTPSPGLWQSFSVNWNSGAATSLTLKIFDENGITNLPGNDFALDDISLTTAATTTAVPEPSSAVLFGTVTALMGLFARMKRVTRRSTEAADGAV